MGVARVWVGLGLGTDADVFGVDLERFGPCFGRLLFPLALAAPTRFARVCARVCARADGGGGGLCVLLLLCELGGTLGLLLGGADGKELCVVRGLLDLVLDALLLGPEVALLALDAPGGDEALDLGRLGAELLLALVRELAPDDKLADVVGLVEVKQLADLRRTLGTKTAGADDISDAGELCRSTLDNDEVEDRQVLGNNAPTDRLALHHSLAARPVSLGSRTEQKPRPVGEQHTLDHGETLLVHPAHNLEHIPGKLLTKRVARNLLRDTQVVEVPHLELFLNLDRLLSARRGVSNVQLRIHTHSWSVPTVGKIKTTTMHTKKS